MRKQKNKKKKTFARINLPIQTVKLNEINSFVKGNFQWKGKFSDEQIKLERKIIIIISKKKVRILGFCKTRQKFAHRINLKEKKTIN